MRPTLQLARDPRWLQLAFLAAFLAFGLLARDFPLWHAPLIFASGLFTQWACVRWLAPRLTATDPAGRPPLAPPPAPAPPSPDAWASGSSLFLSAGITCFGLTLLLRTDRPWIALAAPAIAMLGKFLLRVRGRHLFNPANLGLCAVMLLSPHAWVSPAQWGEQAAALLCFGALGLAVAHRAFRSDLSLAFMAAWSAEQAARGLWLGQRAAVLWHQLAQPSLLLFAFFMISDPKTTPLRRDARLAYATTVAAVAHALQHGAFVKSPLIWALLVCAPLVPALDWLGDRFDQRRITESRTAPSPALHGASLEST